MDDNSLCTLVKRPIVGWAVVEYGKRTEEVDENTLVQNLRDMSKPVVCLHVWSVNEVSALHLRFIGDEENCYLWWLCIAGSEFLLSSWGKRKGLYSIFTTTRENTQKMNVRNSLWCYLRMSFYLFILFAFLFLCVLFVLIFFVFSKNQVSLLLYLQSHFLCDFQTSLQSMEALIYHSLCISITTHLGMDW